eukprot:7852605-Pyramimonas_sp.AAC.1
MHPLLPGHLPHQVDTYGILPPRTPPFTQTMELGGFKGCLWGPATEPMPMWCFTAMPAPDDAPFSPISPARTAGDRRNF